MFETVVCRGGRMLAAIFRTECPSGRVGASGTYLAYCRAAEPVSSHSPRLWGSFIARPRARWATRQAASSGIQVREPVYHALICLAAFSDIVRITTRIVRFQCLPAIMSAVRTVAGKNSKRSPETAAEPRGMHLFGRSSGPRALYCRSARLQPA